jgi:hypothetical protein
MFTWPTVNFPKPDVSFGTSTGSSVIRTKMDSGRIRQRKRFDRNFRVATVSWRLSDYEYGVFQSMYKNSVSNGADWFYIELALGNGESTLQTYTARFQADSYSAKYTGFMYWRVTAKLETEDQPEPYSSEVIDALILLDLDINYAESLDDRLHTFIHVTSPSLD